MALPGIPSGMRSAIALRREAPWKGIPQGTCALGAPALGGL